MVLHQGVEQGSVRFLGGDVDVAPRAEFLDQLEHPVMKGFSGVLDLNAPRLSFTGGKQANVVFCVGPVDAYEWQLGIGPGSLVVPWGLGSFVLVWFEMLWPATAEP